MSPAERRILEELGLPVPKTLADYHRLVDRLNALIDKVGDDETHPLAGTLDRMGELIESLNTSTFTNSSKTMASPGSRFATMEGSGKLLAIAGLVLTGVGALLWFPKTRRT